MFKQGESGEGSNITRSTARNLSAFSDDGSKSPPTRTAQVYDCGIVEAYPVIRTVPTDIVSRDRSWESSCGELVGGFVGGGCRTF